MMAILTSPRERSRFFKFAAVGIIGAVEFFGISNLLVAAVDFPLWLAGGIAFICAVLSNFVLNRYWTYPDSRAKHALHQFGLFGVVSAVGLAINQLILRLMEPVMEQIVGSLPFRPPVFPANFWADNLTLALATLIVMFWNFFANRYITYSDVV